MPNANDERDNGIGDWRSEEHELIRRAVDGSGEAFGCLVEQHQTAVFNVCYRLTGERQLAEDMAQEAFLRAYSKLYTFDQSQPFGPWVKKVAANVCLNHWQRHTPVVLSFDDESDDARAEWGMRDAAGDPEAAQELAENARAIRRALGRLPPQYRAVIELCHFQDMSYAQAASMLQIPVSDVKSHLFRARKALASSLRAMREGGAR